MVAYGEVLIAVADLEACRRLASILSQWGLETICAATVGKATAILAGQPVPMVFCQDHLADGSFRDVLRAAKRAKSRVRLVMTSRMDDEDRCLEAIRLGAFDVIPCLCRPADVHRVVSRALRDDGEEPPDGEAREIKIFYDRWKLSVFRFCYLYLGCQDLASEATCEAFSNYLRERLVLQTSPLPPLLMGFAWAAVERRAAPVSQADLPGQSLSAKLLAIPCDQRAIFIMRSVLGMNDPDVALATRLPVERVRHLWLRSLFHLRETLPRKFLKREALRRSGDIGSVESGGALAASSMAFQGGGR